MKTAYIDQVILARLDYLQPGAIEGGQPVVALECALEIASVGLQREHPNSTNFVRVSIFDKTRLRWRVGLPKEHPDSPITAVVLRDRFRPSFKSGDLVEIGVLTSKDRSTFCCPMRNR